MLKFLKDAFKKKEIQRKCLRGICVCFAVTAVILIIYFAVRFASYKNYRNQELNLGKNFTVTAHTGSMGTQDNSVDSIEKAIAAHADVVEFDVRFRPDGTPVMAHDAVSGNTDGVPISEAFEALSKDGVNIKVNLDIKETENLSALQALAKQYGMLDRVFCTGVSEEFVPEVKRQCPEIPYYLNFAPNKSKLGDEDYQQELLERLEKSGAVGINCNYKNANKELADFLHKNGSLLSVWTVDKKEQMAKFLVIGADNITTRNPDVMIELIEHWNG